MTARSPAWPGTWPTSATRPTVTSRSASRSRTGGRSAVGRDLTAPEAAALGLRRIRVQRRVDIGQPALAVEGHVALLAVRGPYHPFVAVFGELGAALVQVGQDRGPVVGAVHADARHDRGPQVGP